MNRSQRRQAGIKGRVKSYTMTDEQLAELKKKSTDESADKAFIAMLGLPLIVLHDKFGFGKQRLQRFMDELLNQYECFDGGYITLDELIEVIKEETGVTVER